MPENLSDNLSSCLHHKFDPFFTGFSAATQFFTCTLFFAYCMNIHVVVVSVLVDDEEIRHPESERWMLSQERGKAFDAI